MHNSDPVNILLVDDQPSKLLSYEAILSELDENLIKAGSAQEALECLLKHEIAVILIDVVMPELDGFELATMIREHPRFQNVAMIFVSAWAHTELIACEAMSVEPWTTCQFRSCRNFCGQKCATLRSFIEKPVSLNYSQYTLGTGLSVSPACGESERY